MEFLDRPTLEEEKNTLENRLFELGGTIDENGAKYRALSEQTQETSEEALRILQNAGVLDKNDEQLAALEAEQIRLNVEFDTVNKRLSEIDRLLDTAETEN